MSKQMQNEQPDCVDLKTGRSEIRQSDGSENVPEASDVQGEDQNASGSPKPASFPQPLKRSRGRPTNRETLGVPLDSFVGDLSPASSSAASSSASKRTAPGSGEKRGRGRPPKQRSPGAAPHPPKKPIIEDSESEFDSDAFDVSDNEDETYEPYSIGVSKAEHKREMKKKRQAAAAKEEEEDEEA